MWGLARVNTYSAFNEQFKTLFAIINQERRDNSIAIEMIYLSICQRSSKTPSINPILFSVSPWSHAISCNILRNFEKLHLKFSSDFILFGNSVLRFVLLTKASFSHSLHKYFNRKMNRQTGRRQFGRFYSSRFVSFIVSST